PAFSKLFIQGEYDQKNKLLVFKRQSRKDDETLCLATGFAEDFDFDYGLSREAVLKSPNGISSLLTSKLTLYKDGTPDICTVFRIPISILPKQQVTKTLILCAASTREEAVERVLKARADGKLSPLTASPSPFKDDKIDGVIASTVLPHILFSQKQSKETQIFRIENSLYKRSIWAFGISGDNPIIFTQIDKQDEISRIAPYVRLAGKLRKSGIITDLVIGYKENGEYTAPL
ncbi:MAG: hypothetical protein RSD17_05120, partial [Oscillospiraceae bacterium]